MGIGREAGVAAGTGTRGRDGDRERVWLGARVRAGGGAGWAAGRKDGPAWAVSLLSPSHTFFNRKELERRKEREG